MIRIVFIFLLLINFTINNGFAKVEGESSTVAINAPIANTNASPFNFNEISTNDADMTLAPQWSLNSMEDVQKNLREIRIGEKSVLMRNLLKPLLIKGDIPPNSMNNPDDFLHERLMTLLYLGFTEDANALLTKVPTEKRTQTLQQDAILLQLAQNRRNEACNNAKSLINATKLQVFCHISVRNNDQARLLINLEHETNPDSIKDSFFALASSILDGTNVKVDYNDILSIMLSLYQKQSFTVSDINQIPVAFYIWIINSDFMPMEMRMRCATAALNAGITSPNLVRRWYEDLPKFTPEQFKNPRETVKSLPDGMKIAFLWQLSKQPNVKLHLLIKLLHTTGVSTDNWALLFEPVLQNTENIKTLQPSAALIYALFILGDKEQAEILWKKLSNQANPQDKMSMQELLKTWRYDALFNLSPQISNNKNGWHTLLDNQWKKTVYVVQAATIDYVSGHKKPANNSITTAMDVIKFARAMQTIKTSPPTALTLSKHFAVLNAFAPEEKMAFYRAILQQ